MLAASSDGVASQKTRGVQPSRSAAKGSLVDIEPLQVVHKSVEERFAAPLALR